MAEIYWKDWSNKADEYTGGKWDFTRLTSVKTKTMIDADGVLTAVYFDGNPPKWITDGPYHSESITIYPDGRVEVDVDCGHAGRKW